MTFHPHADDPFLSAAVAAARAAGQRQRAALGTDKVVDEATDHDVKLQLDKQCQEQITEHLLAAFPGHTVFGEEGGSAYDPIGYQWIVDPIDGTVNFFHNFPHFCAAIALQHRGETILAVTYDPNRDECFTALRGKGGLAQRQADPRQPPPPRSGRRWSRPASPRGKGRGRREHRPGHLVRPQRPETADERQRPPSTSPTSRRGVWRSTWSGASAFGTSPGAPLLVREAGGKVELEPLAEVEHGYTLLASNGKVPVRRW